MELSFAQRHLLARRTKWKYRLIRFLGGYDPIHVSFLVYRAGLLVNTVDFPSRRDLINYQADKVKQAILKVDPLYGIVRGYHLQPVGKRDLVKVDAVVARRETKIHPIPCEMLTEARASGVLDETPRAEA